MNDLAITATVTIPASDLVWVAVRSSGPGGQNVNKVATQVELRFDLAGTTALPEPVKVRLRALAGRRLDADGRLIVVSQATRSQERNLADTLDKLAHLIRTALVPPKPRRPTRPTLGSQIRRVEAKTRRGLTKRGRTGVMDDG